QYHDDEGWQEPPSAAQPEPAQVDLVPRLPLDQQQRRDEVAAEDEEEVDAEEAAGQIAVPVRVRSRVVEEDADDGESAHAVEARVVRDVRCVAEWLGHLPAAA